ncbi:MAG: hypothetical protein IJI58_04815 [Bacilli bacterium]|nr:hypothetical protein [Bacilli bacterium]
MLDKKSLIKMTKGTIAISGILTTLLLSGCSFDIDEIKSIDISKNKFLIETNDEYDYELENDRIDDIMGFTKEVDSDEEYLDYTYLIDNSVTTTATFAHVIDKKTITSDGKMFDRKSEMSSKTFGEDIIQPIVLPISFTLFNIDGVPDLVDGLAVCDITGTKMVTLEGDILYYFESVVTFENFAERVVALDVHEGDTISAKALYRLNPNGKLDLLYRTQDGYKSDTDNVIMYNYNDSNEIVIPLENTIFAEMKGNYTIEEANEALKEYKKY